MVVPGPSFNDEAQLSPDRKILAFISTESGQPEVYVQPFPGPGLRKRVSNSGGGTPRWRGDGRELFYMTNEGTMMAVDVLAGAALEPGIPRRLFATPIVGGTNSDRYDPTPDGQRFLVLLPLPMPPPAPITVILNWTAGLKK